MSDLNDKLIIKNNKLINDIQNKKNIIKEAFHRQANNFVTKHDEANSNAKTLCISKMNIDNGKYIACFISFNIL